MTWEEAVGAFLDDLATDPQLADVDVLRRGEFAEPNVPSIAWMVFSDRLEENTNPVSLQIDLFARGVDQARTIEARLRARHSDTVQTIQGVRMLVQLEDARDHEDPEPGVVHRSLDFHLEPTR